MPRKARVIVPNCPHHIVQRGHNRNVVFVSDDDYRYYLENLIEAKVELGIQVYAFCLMTNHVHLIVEPNDGVASVAELIKRLVEESRTNLSSVCSRELPKKHGFGYSAGTTRKSACGQRKIC